MFDTVPVIVIPGGREPFGRSCAEGYLVNSMRPPCKPTRYPCPRTMWRMNFRERLPMPAWIPGRLRSSSPLFFWVRSGLKCFVTLEAARNDRLGAGNLVRTLFFSVPAAAFI